MRGVRGQSESKRKKLFKWIALGALTLSIVSGLVNAVGLLGFQHQSISHVSGTAALMGADIFSKPAESLHLAFVILSFVFGAALTGFNIPSTSLQLGRKYHKMLFLEGVFLFLAMYFIQAGSVYGHYLASMAMGVQNAMATNYAGAVLRTTHLTGIFTDLGFMLGATLRGEKFSRRKVTLFILIVSGFVFGGSVGALLFSMIHAFALSIPAAMCWTMAVSYKFFIIKLFQGSLIEKGRVQANFNTKPSLKSNEK